MPREKIDSHLVIVLKIEGGGLNEKESVQARRLTVPQLFPLCKK